MLKVTCDEEVDLMLGVCSLEEGGSSPPTAFFSVLFYIIFLKSTQSFGDL